ncbi:hypothetical protein HanRHA438_Chr09g0403711 [Helianthus annuus]|nr:hypothetical protein HanRHA438_Chr09g0403711 [Helianthus annuus]
MFFIRVLDSCCNNIAFAINLFQKWIKRCLWVNPIYLIDSLQPSLNTGCLN